MVDVPTRIRNWLVELLPDEVRIRCSYWRRLQQIIRFTVQLEIKHENQWLAVVRYDNAHGFCHRDTLHADGSQDKSPVYYGSLNETFTRAIEELQENWEQHQLRFLRELRQ